MLGSVNMKFQKISREIMDLAPLWRADREEGGGCLGRVAHDLVLAPLGAKNVNASSIKEPFDDWRLPAEKCLSRKPLTYIRTHC